MASEPRAFTRDRLGAGAALVAVAVWSVLWLAPWPTWLLPSPWARTGLALLLFTLPGVGLHAWLLREASSPLIARGAHGFVLSIAMAGTLGLVASLLHLPLEFVLGGMWLAGVFSVTVLSRQALAGTLLARDPGRGHWLNLVPGVAAALVAARLAFAPIGGIDDFTYVALVNKFLNADWLGFGSVAFGDDITIPPRYWLSFWPLCEALVAWKSGIPPLELITNYLAPPLAVASFATVFTLCRGLGWSYRTSSVALVGQLAGLVLLASHGNRAGAIFFNRLTEDKVVAAFLIAPICFAAACSLLDRTTARRSLLVFLTYLALLFTHPTIFGIAYLITIAAAAGWWIGTQPRRAILTLVVLTTLMVAAASTLRFTRHPSQSRVHFSVTDAGGVDALAPFRTRRLMIREDPRFYGVSRQVVPLGELVVGALVLGVALATLRAERASGFVAGSLVVVGLVTLPETGWLIGSLITPFHLWRVPWLVPFGVAIALLVHLGVRAVPWPRVPAARRGLAALVIALELLSVWASTRVAAHGHGRRVLASQNIPWDWQTTHYLDREAFRREIACPRSYADLTDVGAWIDDHAPQGALVVGDIESHTNDLIPSVSATARLIAFRDPDQTVDNAAVTLPEAEARLRTLDQMTRQPMSGSERLHLLAEAGVDYVLLCGRPRWQWAEALAAERPERFSLVLSRFAFRLYRVHRTP